MTAGGSSIPEVQRLLAVLAAGRRCAEHVGDWRDVLPARGPFELVFLDEGAAKYEEQTLELAAPGGLFLLDDLTPGRPGADPLRELWLGRLPVVAAEILTTPATAAILAVRR